MKLKKLHITLATILIWSFSFAQQYTNYTTKNGLPSNHIYKITQDYQGFIWFLTDKGMVKYNGKTFKIFTTKEGLPTNDIWDIKIGHDNKIWFFTKATKLGYIKNDKVFPFESEQKGEILYPTIISQNKNNIYFSNSIKNYELKDNLWKSKKINTDLGYVEYLDHSLLKNIILKPERDSIVVYNKNNKRVKAFKINANFLNHKYRGQINDSLYCWLNSKSTHYLNLNTLKFTESKFNFSPKKFTRFTAVNNKLQISGEDFVSFLDTNLQFKNVVHIPKKFHSHFSFIDKNNNLWIATFSNGVYFLPASNRTSTYSLQNEKVSKLQNVNGSIIASVYNKGFYKYDTLQNEFKPFLPIHDFIFSANYIKELNTSYYIANEQMIQIKNNIKTKRTYEDFARNLVYFDNYLYANTSFGLNKINPKGFSLEKELLQNGIRNMVLFNNKLFLATASGIKQLSNDKFSDVSIGNLTFNKPITSFSKFNEKELIVGTDGFGAYCTDLSKIELLEQSEYLNIQSSFIENDNIWLATNKGVWQYKKEGKTIKLIKKYTTNNGLSLNQTNDVYVLDDKLIASSNDGISIIPISQKENNQFIDLYFDEVTYNSHKIKNAKVNYSANNHLQVKVASIDFSSDKKFEYQYQLVPIQKKWIRTTSNQISFNDLPPNNYQLNIKSNTKENSLSFIIAPLWYQTNLFNFLVLLLGIITLYFFQRLNQKRIENREKKKAEIQQKTIEQELYALRSQMNPHFVFNSLSAIQYYINDNDFETSEAYLIKFSRLIRHFFELSKEAEITLREEITLLKSYLEIEKMRFREKLSFKINIDKALNINEIKIPTMLLQPIVENAVNHGIFNKIDNGLITLNFIKKDKKTYQVEILDDGVGFINTKKHQEKKKNSSMILRDKLHYLNEHQKWRIIYTTKELYPTKKDKGNMSKFIITQL